MDWTKKLMFGCTLLKNLIRHRACGNKLVKSYKACLYRLFGLGFFYSNPLGARRASFTGEIYFLHLRRQGRVKCVLLALAAYQVILMQSNQYAIMGYLGTACPEP